MGNSAGSLKKHIETAEKTGALNFTDKGLEKFPPDLTKVDLIPLASKCLYQCSGSTCFWASRIRILVSLSKYSKKNLDFHCFCDIFLTFYL
jgi:hypothetical protein